MGLIQRFGARIFKNPDIDRLIQLLSKLLVDSSGEVRNLSKLATTALKSVASSQEEFDQLLCRNLANHEVVKINLALENKSEGLKLELREASDSPLKQRGEDSPK